MAEAVGQALHYGLMTGKKGKVVLISANPKVEGIYFERVKKWGKFIILTRNTLRPKFWMSKAVNVLFRIVSARGVI